jgi:Caudovirus prohead serine protease
MLTTTFSVVAARRFRVQNTENFNSANADILFNMLGTPMHHILCPFEFKSDGDDDGTIRGYGSVFGNVDSYGDTVAKGAFKKTIADAKAGNTQWPVMLSQHDSHTPIGIRTGLDEDERGLKLKGKLAINTKRGGEA